MNRDRRRVLRMAGLCAGGSLAGCLGAPGDASPDDGTGTAGIEEYDAIGIGARNDPPDWRLRDEVGAVTVVDGPERERAVLGASDVPEERQDALREFGEGLDYGTERLVLVEAGGPNACYDRLDVDEVRIDGDRLRASASVVDTGGEDVDCAQVESYPAALLRVTFGDDPLDAAAIDVTDGWGETGTITADADDPLSPDPEDLAGSVRPDEGPDPIAPLECDEEGSERHGQGFDEEDLQWGDVERDGDPALALRVDALEYGYGDTVEIRLTNVADRTVETGNRAKHNLQVYTEDGWRDVRVVEGERPVAYTDEAIVHPPGEGFEWSLELTEEGIAEAAVHDSLSVCPDLPAGRYRFAFWGVIGGAIAVSFDVVR